MMIPGSEATRLANMSDPAGTREWEIPVGPITSLVFRRP